ncbi:MAG: ribonuclease HII [Thermofilum sp.]
MYLAGVDEAGRGPLFGPMVIAIAVIGEEKERLLAELGVRDSKLLTPSRREVVRAQMEKLLDFYSLRVVEPREIDEAVSRGGLNLLEAKVICELVRRALEKTPLGVVYVDSPDPKPERFGSLLSQMLGGSVRVVARNGADRDFAIVAAASILAKTERDRLVEQLKRRYGDFGSGYPSDPRTREFAEKWLREHGEPPPFARKSWSTWSSLRKKESLERFLV